MCEDTIKRHGRQGQNQHGVDVYSYVEKYGGYCGIQCKGKDDYTSYSLQYNYNNGDNPRFTAYSSSQTPISLYKYVPAYSDYSTTCNGLDNSLNVTFSVPEGAYTEAKNVTLGSLSGTTIYYTLDGSDPSSSATRSTYTAPVALSTSGTYTIKAFAISSTAHSSVTQATYTINIPLTTMDQIFARAKQVGGTPTDVNVTFDNWVVTGKTSNNAYLTDGTKGLIIYANSHGFNVGDKLSGTAACKVQLYKGASELTNLTSSTTGLTVTTGGVITPVEKAITALDSINTGAPIIVTEVTYNGTNLVDVSSNSIKPYNKLYSEMSFTSGKKYNVTGLYCQFEDTKQIMPRSAADIVEVKESAELAWSAASATVTYGAGDNEFPSLTNPHSVTVAYSSTNTAVATIESNGAITLLKAGETTIKATLSGDATYADAEVSYTLTVNKGDAELAWSAASATVKIGADDNVFPTLSNPHSVSVSYSCSHTSLATIDSEGVITLIEGGGVDATITATLSGDDKYADAVVSYTLTIKRGDPALAWKISDATVDAATVTIEAGDNVFPTLYNPHNLPVTYSSSKTDTATINSSTGAISLVGAGKTTITASFAGSGAYNSGSASYTLTVNPAVKPASAFTWTAASKTTEFTSSSAGLLPKIQNLENTIDTALIQFTSSDATVAEPRRPYYENSTWLVPINFKKPGTVTISAVFAGNDDYSGKTVAYELTITKGKCPIYWNNETGSATFFNNSTNYATLRGTDYYDGIDVVYSSSNENVATIDASTGVITQVAAGTCEIRATSDDERFRDTTVAYTLTLNKANLGSALEWTNGVADAGSLTIYGGDASWSVPSFHINSLTMYSVEDDIVLTSSNTDVATVTPGQKYVDLTAVGGTTTVTASVPANHPKVNETSITYTLTFVPQVSLYSAFNSWSSTDYMTNSGDYTSASKTYSLTTGTTYIFRVKANGTWYSDDAATLTRASNSVSDVKVANSEYLRITPDKDGDYTFTWNYATKSLTVEYPEHIPAGVIEVTPTSIDFGSAKKGTTSKHPVTGDDVQNLYRDVTITASNLTADIELEATQNGGGALFGVSEYVIYQSAGVINKTVQVRLSTNYVGTFNGKLTITSKAALVDFEPIVINLTGVIEDTATGVEDVETEGQAVKRLINGQLFIIRGEKMYDAQGKLVK